MAAAGLTFPLLPRRRIAGLAFGPMRSTRRGSGADLAGLRPYRPGDDTRWIDHASSARLSSARGSDELVVREHHIEEAARVVVVVDRRPSMGLCPDGLPWLRKPAVLVEAGGMIVDSALLSRCPVGYLAYETSSFWRAPERTDPRHVKERYLAHAGFGAPADCLARAFGELASSARLQSGSFVFILSDFLVSPPEFAWRALLARRWEVVPVVIQDPVWEQSFPDVAGAVLPLADPVSGRVRNVRLTRAGVEARRRENEERLSHLLGGFEALGLDWILLSQAGPEAVHAAFLDWAESRRAGARVLR